MTTIKTRTEVRKQFDRIEATLKTRDQVRKQFDRMGMTVARWAREHNVNATACYAVLYGKNKGKRGEAHRVAVLLGLKDGIA